MYNMKFNNLNAQRFAQIVMACLLCLVSSTALASVQAVTNPGFVAIDAYVTTRMKDLRIPGVAIGIVKDDQIIYLRGFGIADPSGRPVTPQTPFRLASVSKMITALAIMQLAEAGKVELDAPVQRYLPWFRVASGTISTAEESSLITVGHLLNHTSGIPQSAGNDNFFNGDLSDVALENNVRQLTRVALNRPVGTTYQYANLNYDVLGLIVQVVSGQTYEAYIQEHLFASLAMHGSFTSQAEAHAQGMATGYRQWFGFPVPASLPDDRATRPSSFLISNAEDLTHLLIAELNGGRYGNTTVLSPDGITATQRPTTRIGETDMRSGMGMEVGQVNGVYIAGKTGGTANYNARIVLAPLDGWGVVVLANTFDIGLGGHFDTLADGIVAILVYGQAPKVLPAPIGGGSAVLKFVLTGVVVFQIVPLFSVSNTLKSASRDRRWLARHIGVPLALDVALALILLLVIPRVMHTPLSFLGYFAPDIFWLTIAVVTIPLGRDVFKGLLILRMLRPARIVRTGFSAG
jgi:CubicO group peptidase (beta-lactamase class C family)